MALNPPADFCGFSVDILLGSKDGVSSSLILTYLLADKSAGIAYAAVFRTVSNELKKGARLS
jgi:hypothetical protein